MLFSRLRMGRDPDGRIADVRHWPLGVEGRPLGIVRAWLIDALCETWRRKDRDLRSGVLAERFDEVVDLFGCRALR